jgi:hypothetical protein
MSAFRAAIYPQVLMNFGPLAIGETLYCSVYPKWRTKSTKESGACGWRTASKINSKERVGGEQNSDMA